MTPAAAKIVVDGIAKRFDGRDGELVAIDGLSLSVPEGTFFVVVGASGCGKTTLLRILAGLDEPSAGSVAIATGAQGRPETAIIFQEQSIFPWMTVWDNAAYGLAMRGVPKQEIREVVSRYLAQVGLAGFERAYPHQLSGGMKQRVAIVRAFVNDPEVLLMDEPFSALDELNKMRLQQELLRIWEQTRKTVVFITHSVDEAIALGDQVMVMSSRPGRMKALIDVPFERPRDILELRGLPEYGALVHEIWSTLQAEVEGEHSGAGRRAA